MAITRLLAVHIYLQSAATTGRSITGSLINRTYGGHKNLYINIFLITIFGPTYYRPPKIERIEVSAELPAREYAFESHVFVGELLNSAPHDRSPENS